MRYRCHNSGSRRQVPGLRPWFATDKLELGLSAMLKLRATPPPPTSSSPREVLPGEQLLCFYFLGEGILQVQVTEFHTLELPRLLPSLPFFCETLEAKPATLTWPLTPPAQG